MSIDVESRSHAGHATWQLAGLLLRPRRGAGDSRSVLTLLSVVAFCVTQLLLLDVVGGLQMFVHRNASPQTPWQRESSGMYIVLAVMAAVMLVVPLLGLGSAAARLGASRREQRLARLRLLGATPGDVTALSTLEVLEQAGVGIVAGSVIAYATCPLWSAISFQGSRIGAYELAAGPVTLLAVSVGVLGMALVSALVGLRRVRITPLGVARRSRTPEVHVIRVVVVVLLAVVWLVAGRLLRYFGTAVAVGLVVGMIAAFMAAVNFAGPYLVKLFGSVLAGTATAPGRLLAGRRLVQDPQAAWRSISALAFTSFVAACTILVPALSQADGADGATLGADIMTGTFVTLGIAFAVTAVSTGISQASAVLERAEDARTLSLTGAPAALQTSARRNEVLAPVLLAVVPSVLVGLVFQLPLIGSALASRMAITGFVALVVEVGMGITLVIAAEEMCGPLQRRVLSERRRKAD